MKTNAVAAFAGSLLIAAFVSSVAKATIIDDWSTVKAPAAPVLKPVDVKTSDTALLLLDFNGAQNPEKGPCNTKTKQRCIASLPKVEKLMKEARASGVPVVYSITGGATSGDIATALAPKEGDPVVQSGANKFINTDLEKILKDKGVKTVIVTGTASEGAVLNTAAYAALKGMNVILPVDGMSSTNPYAEQYVAWHFANAPGVSAKTTLTAIDEIKFGK
ncbi:isochorismatase family protein [Rhizobium leguminosarum]|jgi:nicotinamidase-related amidase|uniref:Isochorismatase family protein n=2 Tax=Rhizobium TaxID=379 RepID=A0A444HX52_RHILE|nr:MULTISPECIES: isochorismatase family protein [Rhizobium]MBY5457609.1 cysteine hydrolase [Rhizobium leguminosarum]NKL65309.1 isochorismatase family protein [Rhizobium leguminosarum bv. viciae]RWX28536.1 isochorismatase family protein [Rhizobium leguminosarum]TAU53484.1 isochorismatase family protein [Rhizobium leguminosarum]TBC73504.1 isochorismatase family protein [Rhizobium leguminosarum]